MVRRWAAWTVVLIVLVAMAAARLADRKERVHRELSNVTMREPGSGAAGAEESHDGARAEEGDR
jgi:hypothetical protein